jgi:cysteine-rich repeat protein
VDGSNGSNAGCVDGEGCTITLIDVEVVDGRADDPTSWPPGSGGNLAANPVGMTPGRIRLEGTTTVSGGSDLSMAPQHAPDCYGAITVVGTGVTIGTTAGCAVTYEGTPPPPVCGNGVVEAGEECDDGNTSTQDACGYPACNTQTQQCMWVDVP